MTAGQSTQTLSPLGTERISSLMLRFSWPAIVGAVTTALYNFSDRIFVGQGVGADGVAAVAVSYPLMLLMIAFGMLIAFGGNTLAAISLGENQADKAALVVGNAFTLYLLLTVVFTLFGFLFMAPLLTLFGASSNLLPLAESYFSIILLGVLGHEISFGMNSFIRLADKPRIAMITMLIGGVLNLLLDGLFIFVFDWGVRGAALATIIAQAISACWVMSFLLSSKCIFRLRLVNLKLRQSLVRKIVIAGAPMWLIAMTGCTIQALMNNRLQLFGGDHAVAVMGVVFSVFILIRTPVTGLIQGVQPIVSYNYGALQFQRVGKILKLVLVNTAILVGFCYLVVQLFPQEVLRVFNLDDPELLKIGVHAIRTFLLMLPLSAVLVVVINFFQAIGKPFTAISLIICHQFLLMAPLIVILPSYFGLDGIWLAAPLAEASASLIAIYCLLKETAGWEKEETTGQGVTRCSLAAEA